MKKFVGWNYQKFRHCKRKGHVPEVTVIEMLSNGSREQGSGLGEEKNFTNLWNTKLSNICIIWISKKNGGRRIFKEVRAKMFPNMIKTINVHIQETQWTLMRIKTNKTVSSDIFIILLKTSEKEKL